MDRAERQAIIDALTSNEPKTEPCGSVVEYEPIPPRRKRYSKPVRWSRDTSAKKEPEKWVPPHMRRKK